VLSCTSPEDCHTLHDQVCGDSELISSAGEYVDDNFRFCCGEQKFEIFLSS
jgi:hypothetical protein